MHTTCFPTQKLVNETFQKLWFTPTPSHDKDAMTRKILNITDVVCTNLACDEKMLLLLLEKETFLCLMSQL